MVVCLSDPSIVDALETGTDVRRRLHLMDDERRTNHLDDHAFRTDTTINPVYIVVTVVPSLDELVHPRLRQGLNVMDVEALLAHTNHVRSSPGEGDRITTIPEGPRQNKRTDGVRECVPVKEDQHGQIAATQTEGCRTEGR